MAFTRGRSGSHPRPSGAMPVGRLVHGFGQQDSHFNVQATRCGVTLHEESHSMQNAQTSRSRCRNNTLKPASPCCLKSARFDHVLALRTVKTSRNLPTSPESVLYTPTSAL